MVYKLGSKGESVRQIQRRVGCIVTAVYDTKTRRAVMAFQKDSGVRQTGDVDQDTLLLMFPPAKNIIKPSVKVAKVEKKQYIVEDKKIKDETNES